ncbi:MAG: plastocyanin/azurin family copper-binding protein [Sphingobacteriaceae bacterium]
MISRYLKTSRLYFKACLLITLALGINADIVAQNAADTARIQKEEDFYTILTVPIPKEIELEVGGMTFLPDDELAVCTRRGEVWKIRNPYMKNGQAPKYKLFADGLHEPLGLNYIKGELYVTHRSEITRLRDIDGDDVADEYKTVYTWPLSGNYHEYAYGPILDKEGNLAVTLNLAWTYKGISLSKWHGWMLKITPDGKMKPFAAGFRSPSAFATNNAGDIFYAENQGGWVGSGGISHVEEGDFMGNPESLIWSDLPDSPVKLKMADVPSTGEPKFEAAKKISGLKNTAVWFPHAILGISTSGILNYNDKGKMGPFEGQLFVGDQGQSKIMRVYLEKVNGEYQGAVFPFREGFNSGVLRMNWGSDGSMFVGMTSRGWGSTGPDVFGLQRLLWNGKIPFEIRTIKAMPDGFELEFTQPVDEKRARDVNSYKLTRFTYMYSHHYGSPVINQGNCPLQAINVSPDGLTVRLVVDSLKQGYIHEIKAKGVRSLGNYSLLHDFGYYTLNSIPQGEKLAITAVNKVSLPTVKHAHSPIAKELDAKRDSKKAVSMPAASSKHVTKQPASWTKGADQTIVLTPMPGLKYNISSITAKAGAKIKLTFNNTDDMLHNVVITIPGAIDEIGVMALNMGLNGEMLSFIPKSEKILHHTLLLQPGKSETIYFTAPIQPGNYSYVCTYPGHYLVMRGILKIIAP